MIFTWPVYQEYHFDSQWEEGADGLQQVEYIRADILSGHKEIRPVEYPALYLKLSKVATKEESLDFGHRYGLLTNKTEERVNDFLSHAHELRECLELYEALQNNDSLGIENNKLGELVKARIFAEEMSPEEMAKKALAEHISGRLKGAGYRMYNLKLLPFCNTLLEAVYLKVAEIIDKEAELVRCKECGSLFKPVRAGQQFCLPGTGKGRSPCQNRYAVRKWREEEQVKDKVYSLWEEGKLLDEIMQATGLSAEKMQSLLGNICKEV
ncbi:MAG: hypothetical protein C4589_03020 [Peptococcaceae bacterium]|nr:MAG: hypothetical protein C4589_03020 [Peptococcaceae bacterium]